MNEKYRCHVQPHFVLNSMENARQEVDVSADARTLHEVYLPHFTRVVDAGVAAVMKVFGEFQAAPNATVTVLRNGQKLTIEFSTK